MEEKVNHPKHYNYGKIEVVDIWKDQFTVEELKGAYKSNIVKYVLRADHKNGLEDYKKARVYLSWLIELLERQAEDERIPSTKI